MGADVLATQGARASATMIFTSFTGLIRSPHVKGFKYYQSVLQDKVKVSSYFTVTILHGKQISETNFRITDKKYSQHLCIFRLITILRKVSLQFVTTPRNQDIFSFLSNRNLSYKVTDTAVNLFGPFKSVLAFRSTIKRFIHLK